MTSRSDISSAAVEQAASLADADIVFVDVETTGGNAAFHRITEIALVGARGGHLQWRWSSLVNPGRAIPPGIQALTGITNEMVAAAPPFADIATEVLQRLGDRQFIAHNARFDYSFIRQEFARVGIRFVRRPLCTVRLARNLYPGLGRYNLDTLIERLDLHCEKRHRAMPDADALLQLWRRMGRDFAPSRIALAVDAVLARPALPPQLAADTIDDLPDVPGVYRFYAGDGALLYVGKARRLRDRVGAHFQKLPRAGKALRLAQQTAHIEYERCAGEVGALLRELRWVREAAPVYNRRLRANPLRCSWLFAGASDAPRLVALADLKLQSGEDAFGCYQNERAARRALESLARQQRVCLKVLGLERGMGGCFALQVDQCDGACIGRAATAPHLLRAKLAMASQRLQRWPYPGPMLLCERSHERSDFHLLDDWRHLQSFAVDSTDHAQSDLQAMLEPWLEHRDLPPFDPDQYRILRRAVKTAEMIDPGALRGSFRS
ncbi:MAG: exonuclease domain-containing protein [Steroidobacteraceae bacterium]